MKAPPGPAGRPEPGGRPPSRSRGERRGRAWRPSRGRTGLCLVSSRLTSRVWCRACADKWCPGRSPWWLGRGKFFGRCAALQSEGEAFIVVPGLPAPKGGRGRLEVWEALPAPELLLVDPMAPLDFAVLLRPAGPNVSVPDPGGLDPEREGEG